MIAFLVGFSGVFWLIHNQFETVISRSTQNGLAGFYSVVGVIFGLVVAFVIQREWEIWSKLSGAVAREIDAVREMWKWSMYADASLSKQAQGHLEQYLKLIVSEWKSGKEDKRSRNVDEELDQLRGMLTTMSQTMLGLNVQLFEAFTNLVEARNQRLNYSNEHIPGVLKRIVILADILMIILSLFVAVNNITLDYIFTAAIGILAFALILVVDDLDNPFRPGTWHLTTEGYEELLTELTKK